MEGDSRDTSRRGRTGDEEGQSSFTTALRARGRGSGLCAAGGGQSRGPLPVFPSCVDVITRLKLLKPRPTLSPQCLFLLEGTCSRVGGGFEAVIFILTELSHTDKIVLFQGKSASRCFP